MASSTDFSASLVPAIGKRATPSRLSLTPSTRSFVKLRMLY